MKDKIWETTHAGRKIRVINRISFLPPHTSEALEVDGEIVVENKGGFLRMFSILNADVDFHGIHNRVEARIAQKVNSFRTGCHIYVNGELMGGDIDARLQLPDPDAVEKHYKEGATRYILKIGLLQYGLPFALLMTLLNRPESITATLTTFSIQLVGFGVAMGWIMWRSLKSQAEKKKRA